MKKNYFHKILTVSKHSQFEVALHLSSLGESHEAYRGASGARGGCQPPIARGGVNCPQRRRGRQLPVEGGQKQKINTSHEPEKHGHNISLLISSLDLAA